MLVSLFDLCRFNKFIIGIKEVLKISAETCEVTKGVEIYVEELCALKKEPTICELFLVCDDIQQLILCEWKSHKRTKWILG